MHPSDEKTQLRRAVEERIARLSQREIDAESRTLCRQLLPHVAGNPVVCAYEPMRTEADVRPLLMEIMRQGGSIFLPCFENGMLTFRQMISGRQLQKGPLGVLEPPRDALLLAEKDATVVLVPGRAFDASGNRLGRGNGGYDRWIRQQRVANPGTRFIGVALECQMVERVPTEPHDERMDAVATARGVGQTCTGC